MWKYTLFLVILFLSACGKEIENVEEVNVNYWENGVRNQKDEVISDKSLVEIFTNAANEAVELDNGKVINKQNSLEQIYSKIGYKNVEDAKREFKQRFKRELKLPLRVPPLAFTHHFGRFIDLDGDVNDSFAANLISEISSELALTIPLYVLIIKPAVINKNAIFFISSP